MKKIILLIALSSLCSLFSISVLAQAQTNLGLEERLTRLEDSDAIRKLILNYGRYVDERNWQAFSELFSEDNGTWNGGMGIAEGRPAIVEMMKSSIADGNVGAGVDGHSNLHLISNEFITVDGNTATALSKWVFVMTAEEGGPEPVFFGHYEDELVKEDGVWRFKYRTVHSDIMGTLNLPE